MTDIQGYTTKENFEMLRLFGNKVGQQPLRTFLPYDTKTRGGCYLDGTNMSSTRADGLVGTVMNCLVEQKKCAGSLYKEENDTYERMAETARRQVVGSFKHRLKHWSWEMVAVEEDGLSVRKEREAIMNMSKTVNNVRKLPSVRKAFISVGRRWFSVYVPDALVRGNSRYDGPFLDDGRI